MNACMHPTKKGNNGVVSCIQWMPTDSRQYTQHPHSTVASYYTYQLRTYLLYFTSSTCYLYCRYQAIIDSHSSRFSVPGIYRRARNPWMVARACCCSVAWPLAPAVRLAAITTTDAAGSSSWSSLVTSAAAARICLLFRTVDCVTVQAASAHFQEVEPRIAARQVAFPSICSARHQTV
jgi:hypothetical protein